MALKTWINGEKAEIVQKIIEYNFKILGKHLPHNILSLSSTDRKLLSSDYLCEGLIVFDTTLKKWMQYFNGNWIDFSPNNKYEISINKSDWFDGEILIPYQVHLVSSPTVQLFILTENDYEAVLGGVKINSNHDIILRSDLEFEGKVVIQ